MFVRLWRKKLQPSLPMKINNDGLVVAIHDLLESNFHFLNQIKSNHKRNMIRLLTYFFFFFCGFFGTIWFSVYAGKITLDQITLGHSIKLKAFCLGAYKIASCFWKDYYAQATAAQDIFGHTLQSLRGIKYLYKYNVFQIAFIVLAGLTFVYYATFGWRRRKPSGKFQLPS